MRAILLLAHGSRDPAWKAPFERLREKIVAQAPTTPVENAYLEHTAPDVIEASRLLVQQGATSIEIVPLFLGPGGHVRSDLPRLAAEIRSAHSGIEVTLAAPVGEADSVIEAIAAYCLQRHN
jgi:sirohydrochlorin cobaltochelatase